MATGEREWLLVAGRSVSQYACVYIAVCCLADCLAAYHFIVSRRRVNIVLAFRRINYIKVRKLQNECCSTSRLSPQTSIKSSFAITSYDVVLGTVWVRTDGSGPRSSSYSACSTHSAIDRRDHEKQRWIRNRAAHLCSWRTIYCEVPVHRAVSVVVGGRLVCMWNSRYIICLHSSLDFISHGCLLQALGCYQLRQCSTQFGKKQHRVGLSWLYILS